MGTAFPLVTTGRDEIHGTSTFVLT